MVVYVVHDITTQITIIIFLYISYDYEMFFLSPSPSLVLLDVASC